MARVHAGLCSHREHHERVQDDLQISQVAKTHQQVFHRSDLLSEKRVGQQEESHQQSDEGASPGAAFHPGRHLQKMLKLFASGQCQSIQTRVGCRSIQRLL